MVRNRNLNGFRKRLPFAQGLHGRVAVVQRIGVVACGVYADSAVFGGYGAALHAIKGQGIGAAVVFIHIRGGCGGCKGAAAVCPVFCHAGGVNKRGDAVDGLRCDVRQGTRRGEHRRIVGSHDGYREILGHCSTMVIRHSDGELFISLFTHAQGGAR